MDEAKLKAAAAYNAAADFYDESALSFWEYFGRRTIARLGLQPGEQILDVCCGSGASAIPAAEMVAPRGEVLAVDLAERLLELGRQKAGRRNLENIQFLAADLETLGLPDDSFEAVVCVFGIFFLPDMPEAIRELWRMVKPGGKLAVTTWGANLFEPMNEVFWSSVKAERPDLYKSFNPWDRICDVSSLDKMLAAGGVETKQISAESYRHPLGSADDWWAIVLGTGYRGTIEQLSVESRERVRQANLEYFRANRVSAVEANVLYAVAVKS